MEKFEVIYRIDITAENPEEAALEAEDILDNRMFRPFFEITDSKGKKTGIDLEKERL